ncbi:DnaJ-domain-containing protein [Polyplosphaeria fusca]|uniref:DnaJ-domain-containing protein n=1 Tax=Polyplosphaeria fusca TaxID=682080 RepID=A0A9P4RBS0_9PLEO|nr:DnaJ-domain-containing protein [Polyplosphaeria fusca]
MQLRPVHLARPLRAARLTPPHHPPSRPCSCNARRHDGKSSFHASAPQRAEALPNHYETLQLPHTATPADIKRQFFSLSKTHHPDKNPNDSNASTRFVAISEAYHVLSVPEKRASYDAHISQQLASSSRWGRSAADEVPKGSYSSASFAGSRPATGLNKKRGTFRGPPPSFYKAGGYGQHGAKRAEYAHQQHASGHEDEGSYGQSGGFGPGQTRQGKEVPHFDDVRHKSVHDHVTEHINARRRARAAERADREIREEMERGNLLFNFTLVSSALVFIGFIGHYFGREDWARKRER